jgi:hypothetical protein
MPSPFKSPAASELGNRAGLVNLMALAKDTDPDPLEARGTTASPANKTVAPTSSAKPMIKIVPFIRTATS